MATAATLSFLPSSVGFSHSNTSSTSCSSSSFFFNGGTQLRSHKNFAFVTPTSSSSCGLCPGGLRSNNGRVSTRRFVVNAASGDYYTTLGVPKSASTKEIKAAYRKLARKVLICSSFSFFFFFLFLSSLKFILLVYRGEDN